MTVIHNTGRASLEKAMARALRREHNSQKIKHWKAREREHINNPEAYDKACEEQRRLGLAKPTRMSREDCMLHMWSHKSRRPVTLPGAPTPEICAREQAEERAVEAVKEAIASLSFHVTALSQIPNPAHKFRNRLQQQWLFDAVRKLSMVTIPPLPTPFSDDFVPRPRVAMQRTCVDCGGPACIEKRGYWYCEDCSP